MKILFLGVAPRADILGALTLNGFEFDVHRRAESVSPEKADILVYSPKNGASLKALAAWRRQNPLAWIAICVDRSWLKNAENHHALLQCDEKNDVWLLDSWENLFWFSLQQITRFYGLRVERDQLRKDYEAVCEASETLLQQLNHNLELATQLQRSLLPKVAPIIPGVSISVKYIPAAGTGGDYYDIFEFGDRKRFGVLIADSDTHGLAASLLSALLKIRLEEMKERFPDSKSFVDFLNREISPFDPSDKGSLSLLYGILDRASLQFHYTIAGRLQPFLWRNGRQETLPHSSNPALGQMTQYDFKEFQVALRPGDLLLLHTDGLNTALGTEQLSAFDQIVSILKQKGPVPDPLELQNELMGLLQAHLSKHPLKDDLTLIHFAVDEKTLYLAKEG